MSKAEGFSRKLLKLVVDLLCLFVSIFLTTAIELGARNSELVREADCLAAHLYKLLKYRG